MRGRRMRRLVTAGWVILATAAAAVAPLPGSADLTAAVALAQPGEPCAGLGPVPAKYVTVGGLYPDQVWDMICEGVIVVNDGDTDPANDDFDTVTIFIPGVGHVTTYNFDPDLGITQGTLLRWLNRVPGTAHLARLEVVDSKAPLNTPSEAIERGYAAPSLSEAFGLNPSACGCRKL